MSLDAYRRHVGGAISITVTGTDHPIPGQLDDRWQGHLESRRVAPQAYGIASQINSAKRVNEQA